MHFWHVWNICWEIIWKYYLHSSKSLIAYKCLRRNFCDVILLQASKKKKKINIIWKNSIQSSNIQFFIFMKMRKQNPFFYYFMIYFHKSISLSALMFQRKRMVEHFYSCLASESISNIRLTFDCNLLSPIQEFELKSVPRM